ncbi:MAG: biotin--[acetyl-CoA-carboxylase] ligase [Victivallaceae bacterium]|nr:biotin--[acetyl-CoA-carboxylase] ligase [Victivallaceae bacterium]
MNPVIIKLDAVDSTNTYARDHFAELPDGAVVASFEQTAGRGRRGRTWVSPPGCCIAVTMVMKNLANGFHAGCVAGLGVRDCVNAALGSNRAFLKWPNDVYIKDRKICGILCESAVISQGRATGVVAGMGLNVNLSMDELARIDLPATSLQAAAGHVFNLDFLLKELAKSLKRYYIICLNNAAELTDRWRAANLLVGESIGVVAADGAGLTGVFEGIASDGAMLLRTATGMVTVNCGDVRVDRSSVDWGRVNKKLGLSD